MARHKHLPLVIIGLLLFTQPLIKDYAFTVLILLTLLTLHHLNTNNTLHRPRNIATTLFLLMLLKLLLNSAGYSLDFYIIAVPAAIITLSGTLTQIELTHQEPLLTEKTAKPTILYLLNGTIIAVLTSLALTNNTLDFNNILFLSVIASLTAALLTVIPHHHKDYTTLTGASMTLWLFADIGYTTTSTQLSAAIIIAFLLSYAAYKKNIADISAMITATLIGMLIITFTDLRWFLALIAFFAIGGGFTKYKYEYKKSRGVAEEKSGVRSYKNVFANSLPAFTLAIAYQVFPTHQDTVLIAYLASLATALADTLASEIGQTSKSQPRMITTLKKTSTGVDGGITLTGELASLLGAAIIAFLALATQLTPPTPLPLLLVLLGGFIGTNIDSLLGATLQQRKLLSNNAVNLASTTAAALITAGLYHLLT